MLPYGVLKVTKSVTLWLLLIGCFQIGINTRSILAETPPEAQIGACLTIDADTQFNYAENLFNLHDYAEAIAEYKRFLHFFADDRRTALALYKMGRCYYYSQQYKKAINAFEKIMDEYGDSEIAIKACYGTSDGYVALYEFGPAINALHNLINFTDDDAVKDNAYYKIGWIYLDKIHLTDLSINSGALEKARASFLKIKAPETYQVAGIISKLDQLKEQPRKSPYLAGIFSVIPGLGYIYCGRYKDALISLIMAGGVSYTAYESFDHEQYALGAFLGVLGVGFYAGSIYGSVSSAYKINRYHDHLYIKAMKPESDYNSGRDRGANDKRMTLAVNISF